MLDQVWRIYCNTDVEVCDRPTTYYLTREHALETWERGGHMIINGQYICREHIADQLLFEARAENA